MPIDNVIAGELSCGMILIAILFPGLSFLFRGKVVHFLVCIILQLTVIGWLPAAIWAVVSISEERNQKRMKAMKISIQNNNTGSSNQEDDKFAQLEKLSNLKDKGVITQEEFEAEKKKVLK